MVTEITKQPESMFVYNVRHFGANGKKEENSQTAIQQAIEACAAAGGGVVYFPPGDYATGTIHLRSHVRIHVEAGATIYSSKEPTSFDQRALFYGENLTPQVNAVSCHYQASDEEVYAALRRATDPLSQAWSKLKKARRIAIKFNQDFMPNRVVMHQGHRQQLVSDIVVRAILRLLRERTSAEIFVTDVGVESLGMGAQRIPGYNILPVLREFEVPFVDGHADPVVWTLVPGGGGMFQRYPVPQSAIEADALVSVQKIKNHAYTGVTLCMKNLFGLIPLQPLGRPRAYYHHLVRMPYMLADLGRIFDPALNILDGLVGQAGEEWGKGEHPRIANALIAGDQVVATDACTAHLMGHDPQADWLTPPFHRDRNALLVAAEGGFGTVDLNQIDFHSEVQPPLGKFFSKQVDSQETVMSWRRTTAEQALYYLDHKQEIMDKHAGEYIMLQMGQVCWHDKVGNIYLSRRELSGMHPEQAMWLKYVDPAEAEGEHFEVYDFVLKQFEALRGASS